MTLQIPRLVLLICIFCCPILAIGQNLDSLRKVTEQHPDMLSRTKAHYHLAYYSMHSPATSLPHAQKAAEGYKALGMPLWQAHSLRLQQKAYRDQNNLADAYRTVFEAMNLYQVAENINYQLRCQVSIALLYREAGEFEKSENWLEKAMASAMALGNSDKNLVHYHMGKLYRIQHRYDEALPHYQATLTHSPSKSRSVNAMLELGELHRCMLLTDSATHYFKAALNLIDGMQDGDRLRGRAYHSMGTLFLEQGNFAKALGYHQISLEAHMNAGKGREWLLTSNATARTHLAMQQPEQALLVAKAGIDYGIQQQLGKELLTAFELAMDACTSLGRTDELVAFIKTSRPYYHSEQWHMSQEAVADQKRQLQEGEMMVQQALMYNKVQHAHDYYKWGLLIGCAIFSLLLAASLYYRRRYRKANNELDYVANETYRIFATMAKVQKELEAQQDETDH